MRYNRSSLSPVGSRSLLAGLLGLLALAASTGCGSGKLPLYRVSGTVQVDGKPAPGAMVIFCPTDGSEEVKKHRPFGITGPDGRFELTTFQKADGAPSANYKILVQWLGGGSKPVDDGRGGIILGPDHLRGRYMNLEQSQLTATVSDDDIDLPPFQLKSK
jgi:hypothetical protein